MNLINLKPCVKCKSDKVKILYLENARYRVECSKCGQYIEFNAQSYLGACVMWNETFGNNYGDRWIPVSKKMPDTEGRYLVSLKHKEFDGKYVDLLHYDDEESFRFRDGMQKRWWEAIAWKPLPLPCKED